MGPVATGFFIAGVFLVVGCFLDAIPAIIIVGAILQPSRRAWAWTRSTSPWSA
jgi:TRAP-type C4-dicarboxylate transport system permease large subunit